MQSPKSSLSAYIAVTAVFAAAAGLVASNTGWANAGALRLAAKKTADRCTYPATEDALLSCRRREHDRAETVIARLVAHLKRNYVADTALTEVFSTAQTKWAEFRDAECKLKTYDSKDGTAYESYWLECLAKLDDDRIKVLDDLRDHP